MKISFIISLLALSLQAYAASAWAEDANTASAEHEPQLSMTEAWLKLQREGEQASPRRQTLSGPAMENINKRYLDSFTRPIPERFDPGSFNNPSSR